MHLTPRTLLLTAGATLTACALVGVIGTLDRPEAATADAVGTTSLVPSAIATKPADTPTRTPAPTPPGPITSSPTPPTSVPAAPSPSANDRHGQGNRETPARRATTPNASPAPSPTAHAPAKPRPAPASRRTVARSSWHPPALRVGTTTITRPRLTSGARVSVTVACAPGAGCSMSGNQLTVSSGTSVTVTWSAPARPGYTQWRTSRVL
jgi:hypothetical protein